jgi:MFS family permease
MIERNRLRPLASGSISRESIGELISDLAEQSANLVRDEMALMRRELREKGKEMQWVMLVIALGTALALIAAGVFCAAMILLLNKYLEPWQSALLVCGVLALGSGVMIGVGISRLKRTSLKPEQTLETLEENKEWLKEIT